MEEHHFIFYYTFLSISFVGAHQLFFIFPFHFGRVLYAHFSVCLQLESLKNGVQRLHDVYGAKVPSQVWREDGKDTMETP